MLWIGLIFLVLLALDIWHYPKAKKTKNKNRSEVFMIVEGLIVLGSFVWWLIQ